MPNFELSPKIAAAIIVVVLVVAGLLLYRGVAGSGPQSTEQSIQTMHKKMLKFPTRQPGIPPPATQPQTR